MTSTVSIAVQALRGAAGVTALVADRVHPFKADQGESRAQVVVTLIAEDEPMLLAGSSQWAWARVRIDCRAKTGTAAENLGEAVKVALRDINNTTILTKTVEFQKQGLDFGDYEDKAGVHRRLIDFYVRWR